MPVIIMVQPAGRKCGQGRSPEAATGHLLLSHWPELRHMATPVTARFWLATCPGNTQLLQKQGWVPMSEWWVRSKEPFWVSPSWRFCEQTVILYFAKLRSTFSVLFAPGGSSFGERDTLCYLFNPFFSFGVLFWACLKYPMIDLCLCRNCKSDVLILIHYLYFRPKFFFFSKYLLNFYTAISQVLTLGNRVLRTSQSSVAFFKTRLFFNWWVSFLIKPSLPVTHRIHTFTKSSSPETCSSLRPFSSLNPLAPFFYPWPCNLDGKDTAASSAPSPFAV